MGFSYTDRWPGGEGGVDNATYIFEGAEKDGHTYGENDEPELEASLWFDCLSRQGVHRASAPRLERRGGDTNADVGCLDDGGVCHGRQLLALHGRIH